MKKLNVFLSVLVLVLVMSVCVDNAMAYFTTYTTARGGRTLSFGSSAMVEETFSAWTKHVTVTSAQDSEPVYVRVKAFSGALYALDYVDEEDRWSPSDDGYYYYNEILYGGESTSELTVHIEAPDEYLDGDQFDVIVIYESTPVQYNADGTPYADWSIRLDSEVNGGNG